MTIMGEISCKELVELASEYIEGILPEAQRARVEAHIEVCQYCSIYVEQMRQTIATLGTLTEDSLDPRTKDDLLHIFRNWKRE